MLNTLDLLAQNALLQDRKVLLLVSGSIAAYKALDLVRAFVKMGAQVRVCMSESACNFVSPLSFEALSHFSVLTPLNERWNLKEAPCPNHISYAKWADLLVLAPASANTLARLAHGLADNLLSATFLACCAPKILAPSMNTHMLEAPVTQENLARLKALGCVVIDPREDWLACNTQGKGAMAEILEIVCVAVRVLGPHSFWQNKEAVITGGGSVEKIDHVRYISNFSSGLQAACLALALYLQGARPTFISSTFALELPTAIRCSKVQSAQEYLKALQSRSNFQDPPFLFMLAAISDYKPLTTHMGKLKKQELGARWDLACMQNVDVLRAVQGFIKIGFKAEAASNEAWENAIKLLEGTGHGHKGCLAVCLNTLDPNPFGSQQNQMYLLSAHLSRHTARLDKLALSFEILDFVQEVYLSGAQPY